MNKLLVKGILVFAQRFVELPWGKRLQVLRRKYMAKGCFNILKMILERDQGFCQSFIIDRLNML